MKRFKLIALALLAVFLTSGSAYATDGDIYRDAYTSEDSSGVWTFTNFMSAGQKTSTVVIETSAATTGAVTAARTGYTFVLEPTSGTAPGGVGYTLKLPAAATGLTYRFLTATNNTLSVKPDGTDRIKYLVLDAGDRVTSPASTGSTLVLIGASGKWYIGAMSGIGDGAFSLWTDGGV